MTKIPERVWLQYYGDGSPEDGDIIDTGDATWCIDKVNEHDVEYVRIEQFVEAIRLLQEEIETNLEWQQATGLHLETPTTPNDLVNELQRLFEEKDNAECKLAEIMKIVGKPDE